MTPLHSERPTFRHPLDSCYQYNIVSNLPLTQHHYTAPSRSLNRTTTDTFWICFGRLPDGDFHCWCLLAVLARIVSVKFVYVLA